MHPVTEHLVFNNKTTMSRSFLKIIEGKQNVKTRIDNHRQKNNTMNNASKIPIQITLVTSKM